MILKKSIRVALASFLLLCFSVAALPLDFFHNHSTEQTVCSKTLKHGSCEHKLHITQKASFCFACTAHFDKHFSLYNPAEASIIQHFIKVSSRYFVTEYTSETFYISLRGPPSIPTF